MSTMHNDVLVVGSGPGGAGVARELARAGARVTVLERGGPHAPSGTIRQAVRELRGAGGGGGGGWWVGRFVDEGVGAGATVRTGALVDPLMVHQGRVQGVALAGGEQLRADTVIVSAGALGTPHLLRAAGLDGAGQ